jgi:hypothetical protein
MVHVVEFLLHHINKIDDAIINSTIDLKALLHNLKKCRRTINI